MYIHVLCPGECMYGLCMVLRIVRSRLHIHLEYCIEHFYFLYVRCCTVLCSTRFLRYIYSSVRL